MQWLEISIKTRSNSIEAVAEALTSAGFSDLVLEDQGEFESFLEENRSYWDYIDEDLQQHLQDLSQIKLYLEDTDAQSLSRLEALLRDLKQRKGESYGPLTIEKQLLADTNWEESWKENYPPQVLGEKLVVIPYWLEGYDLDGRLPVILDPGLTFGTGAHPSTQMVMEVMERKLAPGGSCLDLGSGSGILSIAALRLGAKSAVGVDIDPKAEDIARENAAYNGFGAPEFTALTGNVTEDAALMARLQEKRYDIVLVNIVADVIIALSPVLPRLLDGPSTLICSGILDVRLPEVLDALGKAGLTVTEIHEKEDWRCVAAKKE